jgi:uncharacterized caspase-like protein
MTRRVAALVVAAVVTGATAPLAQDRCAAARDMMAAGLARLQPDASQPTKRDVVEALRRATEMCPGLGDAYYHLSVLGRELKDPRAEIWRQRAEFYGSVAMKGSAPPSGGASTEAAVGPGNPAPVPASVRVSPYVRQKLALVVGIRTFKDPKINALRYTTNDAQAVADALRTLSGFTYVKTLLDDQATTYNIKTEINALGKMAAPEDFVVIYFATHGSPENLDTAGVNYIVTYDTEVNNLYPTAFRMDDLTDDISMRIKAERVVAFLDTCYSGGTFKELPPGWTASSRNVSGEHGLAAARLQGQLQTGGRSVIVENEAPASAGKLPQGVGRVIITASQQSERSWEDGSIGHGYFTYFLIQSLKARNPASIEDIFADIRVKVPEAVRREHRESQNPTMRAAATRSSCISATTCRRAPGGRRRGVARRRSGRRAAHAE